MSCGTLTLPIDWSNPGGATFELAVSRRPAGDSVRRVGALLVNPGGSRRLRHRLRVRGRSLFSPELLQRFDIIGVDRSASPAATVWSARPRRSAGPATPRCRAARPTTPARCTTTSTRSRSPVTWTRAAPPPAGDAALVRRVVRHADDGPDVRRAVPWPGIWCTKPGTLHRPRGTGLRLALDHRGRMPPTQGEFTNVSWRTAAGLSVTVPKVGSVTSSRRSTGCPAGRVPPGRGWIRHRR